MPSTMLFIQALKMADLNFKKEQFVIKLYHPFIINCCRSQFTPMAKSNKERLTQNSQLARGGQGGFRHHLSVHTLNVF